MIGAEDAWDILKKVSPDEREKVLLAAVDPARLLGSLFDIDFLHETAGEPFSMEDFETWVGERYPALKEVVLLVGPHNLAHFPSAHNRGTVVKSAGKGKFVFRDRQNKEGLK